MQSGKFSLPSRGLVSHLNRAMTERPDIPRSRFVGTWTRKTTFDAGLIYPFMVDEILPGDHMKYDVTAYLRMATPLFPIFDNQRIDTHFFFVPNRLLWINWKKMMGEQASPGDSITFSIPIINSGGGFSAHSIYDHMGLPVAISNLSVSALPFRAYRLIFNEWYRDENLVTLTAPATGDGPDSIGSYAIQRRAKTHDYFTSALPWPQKFTAPLAPLVGQAGVVGIGSLDGAFPLINQNVSEVYGGPVQYPFSQSTSVAGSILVRGDFSAGANPEVFAEMTDPSVGLTINALRTAFQIQSLMERDARGGTRYIELVKAHFGVTSPDARMQRPEYIGGGSTPLNITPVAQTAPTTGLTVGALGAAGTALGTHKASYAATEHGYILGLISVKSELSYQQGVHRMWTRRTRYDFYFPSLAHLGEQAVRLDEIYAQGTGADTTAFGYQERWHEYRTRTSEVTGAFRSGLVGTLDAWHLGQFFSPAPTLGATFIGDTPPMTRVLAAGASANNQQYFADIQIRRDAIRPIPAYSTPLSLGRF